MLRRLNFSLWYLFRPPWDSGISPPELFDFLSNHTPGRAIDLGCGTGTNVVTLAQHGWQVTGVDFAPRAIRIAKRKARHAGIRVNLQVGDVTHLKGIQGPFELALDLGCFHGVPARSAYLQQLSRVLAPGAHWLMYGIYKRSADPAAPGLTDTDLGLIQSFGFSLESRREGLDKRTRPSAWFLFRYEPHTSHT
jgi:ubiquinone/menaquinone biosynthesis C-methylase UbiE